MTRLIVKRAAIDEKAILLYPKEMMDRYQTAAFSSRELEYLMFFPPKIIALQKLERYLYWCPLGAQYVAVAEKLL